MSLPRSSKRIFYIFLALGLVLSLLPLPENLQVLRPPLISLILIYWVLGLPRSVSLGFAFSLGLLVDVVQGSLIGLHALQWVVLVFLVTRYSSRIRFAPIWQQSLTVLFLLLNERFLLLWVLLLTGEHNFNLQLWVPAVTGALLWPWLFILMSHLQQREQYKGRH